jgi:hypothetical protein
MAGVELNIVSTAKMAEPVSSNAPMRETIRRNSDVKTADAATIKQQVEAEKTKETKEPKRQEADTLENVVARSEDGDTVQVSKDGAEELKESREGAVVYEAEEASYEPEKEEDFSIERPEIEPPVVETPEVVLLGSDEDEVDGPPFNEYSTGQMEALYQDGDISAYTYNTEISRREALHEQIMEENREFDEDMSELTKNASRVEQTDFTVEAAINSESKFDVKDRLDAVNSTDEARKAAARASEEEGRLWDYQLRA